MVYDGILVRLTTFLLTKINAKNNVNKEIRRQYSIMLNVKIS